MAQGDLQISATVTIGADELIERFVRAQGPGGQHVNKTSTAVELRFDVRGSPSLPEDARERLERLAGARLTLEGVIVLFAQSRSSQHLNREEARERLAALVRQALIRPKRRRPTRPTLASKERRLVGKKTRSDIKAGRGKPRED
jgi:ribosome-associated protein